MKKRFLAFSIAGVLALGIASANAGSVVSANVDLASQVTGVLSVANGGTGGTTGNSGFDNLLGLSTSSITGPVRRQYNGTSDSYTIVPTYNVTDYGAKCDGTSDATTSGATDDTWAIAQAISLAHAAVRANVIFPAGRCVTNSQTIYSNISYKGAGYGITTLMLINGSGATHFLSSYNYATPSEVAYFSIEDMTINGNNAYNAGSDAVHVYGRSYSIRNVEIMYAGRYNFFSDWAGNTNQNMEAYFDRVTLHGSTSDCFFFKGPTDSVADDLITAQCGGVGTHIVYGSISMSNLHSWNNTGIGLQVDNGSFHGTNVRVEGSHTGENILLKGTGNEINGGSSYYCSNGTIKGLVVGTSSSSAIATRVRNFSDFCGTDLTYSTGPDDFNIYLGSTGSITYPTTPLGRYEILDSTDVDDFMTGTQRGGGSKVVALGTSLSGTVNIDMNAGNFFTGTVTGTTTFTVINPPASGISNGFELDLTNGGSQTVSFTNGLWSGGVAPTLTTSGMDRIFGQTSNGGTSISYSVILDVK